MGGKSTVGLSHDAKVHLAFNMALVEHGLCGHRLLKADCAKRDIAGCPLDGPSDGLDVKPVRLGHRRRSYCLRWRGQGGFSCAKVLDETIERNRRVSETRRGESQNSLRQQLSFARRNGLQPARGMGRYAKRSHRIAREGVMRSQGILIRVGPCRFVLP